MVSNDGVYATKEQLNDPLFLASGEFLQSFQWRKLRMLALKKYGNKCQCCGATVNDGIKINVDHIKPRKEFPNLALDIMNLQILCNVCNHGKGNWDNTDWRIKKKETIAPPPKPAKNKRKVKRKTAKKVTKWSDVLTRHGINHTILPCGWHIKFICDGLNFDVYPTTETWMQGREKGSGLDSLIYRVCGTNELDREFRQRFL